MQRLAMRAKRLFTIGLTADSHPSGNLRAGSAWRVFCRDCLSALKGTAGTRGMRSPLWSRLMRLACMLISELAVDPFKLSAAIEAQIAPQVTSVRKRWPYRDLQVVSMGTFPKHGATLRGP